MSADALGINSLLLKWLTEWKNKSEKTGSNMRFVYKNALKSLRAHQTPLYSAADCLQLKYFGEKICSRISHQLSEYNKEHGISEPTPEPGLEDDVPEEASSSSSQPTAKTSKRKTNKSSGANGEQISPLKKKRNYVPRPKSGGFALMVALFKADRDECRSSLPKNELMENSQQYSEESMSVPKCGSRYTGWSSMTTLLKHGLVIVERHRISEYSLSDSGCELAAKLVAYLEGDTNNLGTQSNSQKQRPGKSTLKKIPEAAEEVSEDSVAEDEESDDCIQLDSSDGEPRASSSSSPKGKSSSAASATVTSSQTSETNSQASGQRFAYSPGDFDVVLLVDTREKAPGQAKSHVSSMVSDLQRNGMLLEVRALPVGDFLWVAREKADATRLFVNSLRSKELVLDFIVERKRLDDLVGSIKDGRWFEQKQRLKASGVRTKTYLIEGYGRSNHQKQNLGIPYQNLTQAIIDAQVVDGFNIKYTRDNSDTVAYLVTMTRYMQTYLNNKTLNSYQSNEVVDNVIPKNFYMTYSHFERNSKKVSNFTAGEMFVKTLLQFRGLSLDKAKAVTDYYQTVSDLREAYETCETEKEKQALLSDIKFGPQKRNFGPVLSKKVYLFYTKSKIGL